MHEGVYDRPYASGFVGSRKLVSGLLATEMDDLQSLQPISMAIDQAKHQFVQTRCALGSTGDQKGRPIWVQSELDAAVRSGSGSHGRGPDRKTCRHRCESGLHGVDGGQYEISFSGDLSIRLSGNSIQIQQDDLAFESVDTTRSSGLEYSGHDGRGDESTQGKHAVECLCRHQIVHIRSALPYSTQASPESGWSGAEGSRWHALKGDVLVFEHRPIDRPFGTQHVAPATHLRDGFRHGKAWTDVAARATADDQDVRMSRDLLLAGHHAGTG